MTITNWRCLLRGHDDVKQVCARTQRLSVFCLRRAAAQLRDPAIGIDQARADVRERIHRYNTREVKR